nr:MAG TPA: hypothetical protein [Caudoviricetes sp.]
MKISPGRIFEKTIRENYTVYYEKKLFTNNRRWVSDIYMVSRRFDSVLYYFFLF